MVRCCRLVCLACTLLAFRPIQTRADFIDFEHRPNGTVPADDSSLGNPYNIEGGGTVRFFFDANGNNRYDLGTDILPVFERAGEDGTDGFRSTFTGVSDTARPGYVGQLGDFFLRQPDGIGPVPAPFLILYDTTQVIRSFSGEIWDIDGTSAVNTEQWRVDALNASGTVLASILSPLESTSDASSLDSLPWNFQFRNLPDGLSAVRLTFVGGKTDGVGLAFNNFSPTFAVPEPSAVTLFASGAAGLVLLARRSVKN